LKFIAKYCVIKILVGDNFGRLTQFGKIFLSINRGNINIVQHELTPEFYSPKLYLAKKMCFVCDSSESFVT